MGRASRRKKVSRQSAASTGGQQDKALNEQAGVAPVPGKARSSKRKSSFVPLIAAGVFILIALIHFISSMK